MMRRRIYSLTLILIAMADILAATPAVAVPQLGSAPIREVIAAMTVEEKVSMVLGTGMRLPGLPPERQGPVIGQTSERVAGAAGETLAIPRLGIPSIVLADGPAGVRIKSTRESRPDATFYATAFPVATLLASTWDPALVEQVGRAMGQEVREYGVDVLLAPALNMHRHPLGGRNFEYYSEDPLISGTMAAAMVRGVQSQGVGTAIKHLVANDHEWNRQTMNVKVDERALREIYLRGFEIAIKQGRPWSVMTSYNKINGTYTSESPWLLTKVLREQWGYSGMVMTDWFGGHNAVAQMQAGNDLLMPGANTQQQSLLAALKSGQLQVAVLDRNIENILNLIVRTPSFKKFHNSDKPDLKGDAEIARLAATGGMVLLKNEQQTLPLPAKARLALFGYTSYDLINGGGGSGDVNEAYTVELPEGLTAAGYNIDKRLADNYTAYIHKEQAKRPKVQWFRLPPPIPERELPVAEIDAASKATDIAIVTIGRKSGEFADRNEKDDFTLSAAEQTLISRVTAAYHARGKKVVVVLNNGGVVETASWRDQADAILLAWQSGQEAGNAIADVLAGKVNPSGKLATTFALQLADYPSAVNFPGMVVEPADATDTALRLGAHAAEIEYQDGIFVGYRHFLTHQMAIAYPFGYGLSYTAYRYSDLRLSSDSFQDTLTATVTVTNTGPVAGREVAQLYLTAPAGALAKPAVELKAFAKTRLLQPGESQILALTLTPADLASYDTNAGDWLADAGTYTIRIGASATDIRASKTFQLPEPVRIKP